MPDYLSNIAKRITPYVPGEQPKDKRYIKLNTNENPYPPAPEVFAAISAAAGDLQLYPDPESVLLRTAIARHYGVSAENVFVGNGSDEVLAHAFCAFFAGKKIASPNPGYSFYPVYCDLYGAQFEGADVRDDFSVDVDDLLARGLPVVMANPNAPTSRALDICDIRKIAQTLLLRKQIFLLDEAYSAFSNCGAHELVHEYENLVIVYTFSKSHSLAGLRAGYALGNAELISAMNSIKNSFNSYPLDRLAQAGAQAAICAKDYNKNVINNIIATREDFTRELIGIGFEVLPSQANFIFARLPGVSGEVLQQKLRDAGILVRRFAAPKIKDWLRITIGAVDEMAAVGAALRSIINEL